MRENRHVTSSVRLITLFKPIAVVLIRKAMDVLAGESLLKWP